MGQQRVHSKGDGPSAWIERFAPAVRRGGGVLDLACGGGRHGRLFLQRGHPVCFLDIDTGGVADLRTQSGAEIVPANLEDGSPWPLPGRHFAAIVVTNYLWRPLFPALLETLEPGGLLLYETFMLGQERFGRPSNPDFLLAEDELFERCRSACHVLAFEQGEQAQPRLAMRQRIAARKHGEASA